jgi:nucleoside phosphorylase
MIAPTFLTPLGIEAAAVRRGVRSATIERIGMGPAKATASSDRISRSVPPTSPLVLVGLGGGLAEGAVAGEVIVGSSIQLLDADEVIELEDADSITSALCAAGLVARTAPIVSSARIVHGTAARTAAASRGAAAVDMESYWCGRLAGSHGFSVCRVLSDVPGQDLWSLRTPSALLRALRVIGVVARTVHDLHRSTVELRSVEEADL